MIYVAYILIAMLLLRFTVTLVNFISQPFLKKDQIHDDEPSVSVLIPARNEENNLFQLLSDLQKSGYKNFEVIVCNDRSTDGTIHVLNKFSTTFPTFKWFNSEELAEGWIGKNFACHQLAQKATGDYLLFLDADVRITPDFISKMTGYIKKRDLALLSVFPHQLIKSQGEWCTIPIMNWILLTFLPLPLVRLKWFSSLSAANGQTMMFDSELYRKYYWHKRIKNHNVDDIIIARKMKNEKLAIGVVLGRNDVSCRMYTNYNEAIKGFTRNIHQYFNGNRLWMIFFVIVSWVRIPFIALVLSPIYALICFMLVIIMKYLVSLLSQQSPGKNFIYHFNQLFAMSVISFRNIASAFKGEIEWKGRVYNIK